MASQQNGPAKVPHSSYNSFRQYCLSHGVNFDYAFGNQCVDTPKLLWYQYGLTLQTGNGYAYGCWTLRRNQNAKSPFIAISNKNDIKRGDVIVINRHGSYYTGHICFADEDYKGKNKIKVLGQNQGQGISSGTPSNIVTQDLTYFLGVFRNTKWSSGPGPTPPGPQPGPSPRSSFRSGYPWVLYANKLRNQ